MIQVACSNCGIRILVPLTVQGRAGICFGCGARLEVPAVSDTSQEHDLVFTVGARISERYVIRNPVGKGGMGVVYRAHDTLVNEEVAIKLLSPKLLRTQKGQRDFIQEAQTARRLRHDNIVAVHDISWTGEGILYLIMEFLKGQSLRDMLRGCRQERRLVDVRLAVSCVAQILKALEYAHRTVIHRDLKPENIMVLPGEHVKVLDFGLAKALDEELDAAGAGRRSSGRVIGTWAYAAPEQKKYQQVDSRADLYAVGLILHELLTLRTPTDEPVKVERARNDVSPSLLAVHDRALAEEKEDRWRSAAAFRNALLEAFEQSYRAVSARGLKTHEGKTVSTEGMAYLEGGSFLMGCDEVIEESPEFEAHVDPFYMDKYPVTVEQYRQFLEATGHAEPRFWEAGEFSGPRQPVVGISWENANAYAAWAGKQLPTEVQWEFAARGKENRLYPWGRAEPDSNWCNFGDYLDMPSIVTMHEEGKTPEGVCDLGGNVYEWTRDPFLPYAELRRGDGPPKAAPRCAVRGGCWNSAPEEIRCTHRKGLFPETKAPTVGFRCVLPARSEQER